MHCPNCGKQNSGNHSFCRSCGMRLESVTRAVAEHLSIADSEKLIAKANDALAVQCLAKTLFAGIVGVVIGMGLIAIGKTHDALSLPGVVIMLFGVLLAAYGVLSPMFIQAGKGRRTTKTKAFEPLQSDLYLPPQNVSDTVPSVTDRTTDLLEVKPARISEPKSS